MYVCDMHGGSKAHPLRRLRMVSPCRSHLGEFEPRQIHRELVNDDHRIIVLTRERHAGTLGDFTTRRSL